jgi:CBS domain-containing protein
MMREATRVRDLMSGEVRTVDRNASVASADQIMQSDGVRHLVVLDDEGEEVVGVLSQRDLFRSALARALGYGVHAQDKLLEQLRVKDVMTPDPVTIGPEAALADAAAEILERKIGCLPVLEQGRLVGILTEADFVAAWRRAS